MMAGGDIQTSSVTSLEPQKLVNVTGSVKEHVELKEEGTSLTEKFKYPFKSPEFSKPQYSKQKVGRQRTKNKVRSLFYYYFDTGNWLPFLSDDMVWYYKRNYVNREGKQHDTYKQWKREHREERKTGVVVSLDTYRADRSTSPNRGIPTFRKSKSY